MYTHSTELCVCPVSCPGDKCLTLGTSQLMSPSLCRAAAPRSLCKVKKVVQQEMKHFITASVLPVKEADKGPCRGCCLGSRPVSPLSRGRFKKCTHQHAKMGLCLWPLYFNNPIYKEKNPFQLILFLLPVLLWSLPDLFFLF